MIEELEAMVEDGASLNCLEPYRRRTAVGRK